MQTLFWMYGQNTQPIITDCVQLIFNSNLIVPAELIQWSNIDYSLEYESNEKRM